MTPTRVEADARLTGWGRAFPARSRLVRPGTPEELEAAVTTSSARFVARGLGRSYGDAAQLDGGTVIDTTGVTGLAWTAEGVLRVAAGTSFASLLEWIVPRGWFVPVTPGTRQVTVGGAVAADVHGKNHHRDGAISRHVTRIGLRLPTGDTVEVTRDGDPELFHATTGGMGLTGTILDVDLRLVAVPSSRLAVDTDRCADLDETMAALVATEARHRYTVAWVDLLARGRRLGRGVLGSGDFAPTEALEDPTDPYAYDARSRLAAPRAAPPGLLNRSSLRAFNELWFRKAPSRRRDEIQTIAGFFHPLDAVAGWNRLYGPRGLLQWQSVVPTGHEHVLRRQLQTVAAARVPTFLSVLKRFGPGDPGHLSFPVEGWTLTFDMPMPARSARDELFELLDELDAEVAAVGGRVYFAKDSRLRRELVPAMYPRLGEWQAVQRRVDPDGVLRSDLALRLGLCG